MTIKPPYILDANTFMEASRRYYKFGIAKPFWVGLVDFAKKNVLFSIDKVLQEIKNGDKQDLLKQWATSDFLSYFKSTEKSEIVMVYADLILWADSSTHYKQHAKKTFMKDENADAWVIACAKAYDCTVVTHEIKSNAEKNIPIPNVCEAFGIRYCNTFEMLENIGFTF